MLRLTRKSILALEAVLDIAYNSRTEPVQSRDVTKRQGVPSRYLEQVLQHLVREGVLKGVRGPRGGYVLARERRRVTISDVLRVVSTMDGDEDVAVSSAELGEKVVGPIWKEMNDEILRRYDLITIEDLCVQAADSGIARADRSPPNYSI